MKKMLTNVFGDILFLYKNFFHFNLSKILIVLVTIAYIIALFIPLIIVFLVIFYFLGMFDGTFNPYLFLGNPYYMGFGILFTILAFLAYVIGYSYSQVLLTRLSFGYADRKKLALSKNYYFDKKLFVKFFKLTLALIGIFLLPVLFWIISFIILIMFFGGISESLAVVNTGISNGLSISLLVVTLISLILFLYLSYKTAFVYIILVNKYYKKSELKSVKYYLKKSFKFTKGFKRFFRFVLLLLIIFIISLPVYYFEDYFQTKSDEIRTYITYTSILNAGGDLKEKTLEYEALKLDYAGKDLLELTSEIKKNSSISLLFYVLEFLFIWGLYNMALVSFYKSEKNS